MSLSYIDAYRQMKAGEIPWDVYLDHLLARLAGNGHDDDEIDTMHFELADTDPFGYCIFCWSQRLTWIVKDVSPIKDVFEASRDKPLQDVRDRLDAVRVDHAQDVRKALALLALQDRRADVLKMCMDSGGFPYESYFEDEANRVDEKQDPETFQVLEQSEFRRLYPRRPPRTNETADDEDDDADNEDTELGYDPAVEFDEGGSHPVDW